MRRRRCVDNRCVRTASAIKLTESTGRFVVFEVIADENQVRRETREDEPGARNLTVTFPIQQQTHTVQGAQITQRM